MKVLLGLFLLTLAPAAFAAINISLGGLVELVIYLIVAAVVIGILIWLVAKAPFIPDPGKQIITYIIYFIAALIVIALLLSFIGMPIVNIK